MAGVLSGSLLIYSFPGIGGYNERLKARHPKQIAYIRERMQGAGAWWVTVAWSAFPLVPTDVICYVAGLAKMPPPENGRRRANRLLPAHGGLRLHRCRTEYVLAELNAPE